MEYLYNFDNQKFLQDHKIFDLTYDELNIVNNVIDILKDFTNKDINDLMYIDDEILDYQGVKELLKIYKGMKIYFAGNLIAINFIEHLNILSYLTHKNRITIDSFNLDELKITGNKLFLSTNIIIK